MNCDRRLTGVFSIGLCIALFGMAATHSVFAGGSHESYAIPVSGDILDVHDPSMAKDGNSYYLFSTGDRIPIRTSNDLHSWKSIGSVFQAIPDWAAADIPGATNIWAPDISYYKGEYRLYYAISTFGSNRSDIGLATNSTLDPRSPNYRWIDRGKVMESLHSDDWNAIDPNFVVDKEGGQWLVFGSFWGGIKLVKLDAATGKPASVHPSPLSLAYRPEDPHAIEAPYIVFHKGYYYLFASFDFCCRGAGSTYNVRVGRSASITGPYVDQKGVAMMDGGGTLILTGTNRWAGPGGQSIFHDTNEQWWIVYHSYDGYLGGTPTLRVNPLVWDGGWPGTVLPEEKKQGQ